MIKKPHVFDAGLNADSNLDSFFRESMVVVRTEFFRQTDLQRDLEEIILPDLLGSSAKNIQHMKIWSAGCSEGREPYSIAAIIHRWMMQQHYNRTLDYHASDINGKMINIAKSGVYPYRNKEKVRLNGWEKYLYVVDDEIRVDSVLKNMIRFHQENIMHSKVKEPQDIIVCANVLLYYDPEFRKIIVAELSKKLKSGGYLYLESIGRRYMASLGLNRLGPNSHFFKKI